MKALQFALVLGLSIAGSACITKPPSLTLDTVGPMHQMRNFVRGQGSLTVYTRLITNANDPSHPRHSAYRIYREDGLLLESITNETGSFYGEPENVNLPPGHYTVVAQALGYDTITVPVLIDEGKATVVDLDRDIWTRYAPPDHLWVRLPNGRVAGMKALQ